MKRIINDNQRGILFKNGRYVKLLLPGRYFICGQANAEIFSLTEEVTPSSCSLDTLLSDSSAGKALDTVEVNDGEIALHFLDGRFADVLTSGKHAFWSAAGSHTFVKADITKPDISADIPSYILSGLEGRYCTRIEVAEHQRARLYFDRRFIRLLEPGVYYFWNTAVDVEAGYSDTRLVQKIVSGQEILTTDKVPVRVNMVLSYRLTDYVKPYTEIEDLDDQIHVAAQMALREYIGKHTLDEILAGKDELSGCVFSVLKDREKDFYIEVTEAGVRDIILPGEIRDILSTVLIAEKQAQANVITRREEVASTRSLLNTAKLMEENPTLYRLKELEYIERICGNVGNINLSSGGDVISQLLALLQRNSE